MGIPHAKILKLNWFVQWQIRSLWSEKQIVWTDLQQLAQRFEFVGLGNGDTSDPVARGMRGDAFTPIAKIEGVGQLRGRCFETRLFHGKS